MGLLMNEIVSSILQIALFGIIPFIWWCIAARKYQKFADWIGVKIIRGGRKTLIGIVTLSIAFLFLGILETVLQIIAEQDKTEKLVF